MPLTYTYPKSFPTTAVRLYRFPLHGERRSDRLNLLLQAIHGDLKLVNKKLYDCSQVELAGVGGNMMQAQDKTKLISV